MIRKNKTKYKIGVAIENKSDIAIFRQFLGNKYSIVKLKEGHIRDSHVDIMIFCNKNFLNCFEEIKSIKEETDPLFIPVILNVPTFAICCATLLDTGTETQKRQHIAAALRGE